MTLNRNKLYTLLFLACLAGYSYLYLVLSENFSNNISVDVCLIKHVTTIPCPSCGTTRSIVSLIQGNFYQAFYLNPIGFIVALIMVLSPIWILVDLLRKGRSLFNFYKTTENYLAKAKFAIPLVLLVIINWIWTITKGL